MELKVNEYQLPEKVSFNFEELKTEISAKLNQYEMAIYSDDQMKIAKTDRANLNKLKKALNDERIKREKEYLKPFNEFKAQVNEIICMIDKPIAAIDSQIKAAEEEKKAEKLEKIREYFRKTGFPDWVKIEMILDQKWLNASVSLNTAHGAIDSMLECIEKDLATLSSLPEFSFEAKEVYKCTLDIRKALETANGLSEMQKRKAEEETKKKEMKKEKPFSECMNPPEEPFFNFKEPEEDAVWISFAAKLTTSQAGELRDFFLARGIEFKPL